MEGQLIKIDGYSYQKLFDKKQIHEAVMRVAKQINQHYKDKQHDSHMILVLCAMRGAFLFYGDLVREFNFPVECQFFVPGTYEGKHNVKNRHILIIEDVLDTGLTLKEAISKINQQGPASVNICTLIKRVDHKYPINIGFYGFQTNEFLVGYGLDIDQRCRNWPEIYRKVQ